MAKKSFKFPTDVFLFNIIRIIFPMRLNKALLILNGGGGRERPSNIFFFCNSPWGEGAGVGGREE